MRIVLGFTAFREPLGDDVRSHLAARVGGGRHRSDGSLVAHMLAATILRWVTGVDQAWTVAESGQPLLPARDWGADAGLSLASTAGFAIAAVGLDGMVGVDATRVRATVPRSARRFLAPEDRDSRAMRDPAHIWR